MFSKRDKGATKTSAQSNALRHFIQRNHAICVLHLPHVLHWRCGGCFSVLFANRRGLLLRVSSEVQHC